jgi:hypothetical protein
LTAYSIKYPHTSPKAAFQNKIIVEILKINPIKFSEQIFYIYSLLAQNYPLNKNIAIGSVIPPIPHACFILKTIWGEGGL